MTRIIIIYYDNDKVGIIVDSEI